MDSENNYNNNNNNNNGTHGEDGAMNESFSSGNLVLRPVFLGNLNNTFTSELVCEIFERPICPHSDFDYSVMPVDRVDLKKGYCFVFLKDAVSNEQKSKTERFVSDINGMQVPGVSSAVRAEFAKGDGRIKRKEDDRRQRIHPSETLFVVNFHEETTRRDDLKMLFEPYGELVRIEMKRNYAFVQFKTIEEATKAREEVNGGKLDQSVLTVEYVAQQRGDGDIRRDGGRRGRGESSGGRRGDDRRRPRNDDNRRDDHRRRDHDRRSPPRFHRGGGRSRSRSRSPPRSYRSRSPRGRDYDDRRGNDRHDRRRGSPDIYRRPRSPDDRDRGGDRGSRAGRGGGGPPDGDRDANGDRNGFEGDRERLDRGDRGYRA